MNTVGNVWNISNNAKIFTPKGIVKYTAKQTGKALVRTGNSKVENESVSGNTEGLQPSTSRTHNNLEESNIEFYFPESNLNDMNDTKFIPKKD